MRITKARADELRWRNQVMARAPRTVYRKRPLLSPRGVVIAWQIIVLALLLTALDVVAAIETAVGNTQGQNVTERKP